MLRTFYRHSRDCDSEVSKLAEFRTHQGLYACADYMKVGVQI